MVLPLKPRESDPLWLSVVRISIFPLVLFLPWALSPLVVVLVIQQATMQSKMQEKPSVTASPTSKVMTRQRLPR